ncbi:MAG: ATP-binding protein [Myxococcota bacterium]
MSESLSSEVGRLVGLIVHDLRNPAATLGANVEFLRDVGTPPPEDAVEDIREALDDMRSAVVDLMRGFEQVSWLARWIAGEAPTLRSDAEVAPAVAGATSKFGMLRLRVESLPAGLRAKGGGALPKLLEILLANSERHARHGEVIVRAYRDAAHIVVEVQDEGRSVGEDLRATVFELEAQQVIKTRPDGRYGRVAGLFAAKIVADAIGASLEADGADGSCIFRIRLISAT